MKLEELQCRVGHIWDEAEKYLELLLKHKSCTTFILFLDFVMYKTF